MRVPCEQLTPDAFPPLLSEIPDPPETLWISGTLPSPETKLLTVVGSRKATPYGKEVCKTLIEGLADAPVAIVSGLALGIDAAAHRAALAAGVPTIAVPGSGLSRDVLYPASHYQLAEEIVKAGGALLSEFSPDFRATQWSFPKRNRIMAGMSHATLVIEAAQPSGTLITARLAADYNRDVAAVPGPIFSTQSAGTHWLIKNGAALIRTADDIRELLDLPTQTDAVSASPDTAQLNEKERAIVELLESPCSRDELLQRTSLPTHEAHMVLSALELKRIVIEEYGMLRLRE